tara:strand:+ start:348 stop:533 length:186 start_codon:yes stop_codon:yes gene_type:complete
MAQVISLNKCLTVHLKPNGEICNRLKIGAKVFFIKKKDDWIFINWRGGKKKGWVFLPENFG